MHDEIKRLKQKRLALHITITFCAQQLNIARSTLQRYEEYQHKIPHDFLANYERVLDDCASGKIPYKPYGIVKKPHQIHFTRQNINLFATPNEVLELRTIRIQKGITSKETAKAIGVHYNKVSEWEIGRTMMPRTYMAKIKKFLDETPSRSKNIMPALLYGPAKNFEFVKGVQYIIVPRRAVWTEPNIERDIFPLTYQGKTGHMHIFNCNGWKTTRTDQQLIGMKIIQLNNQGVKS